MGAVEVRDGDARVLPERSRHRLAGDRRRESRGTESCPATFQSGCKARERIRAWEHP